MGRSLNLKGPPHGGAWGCRLARPSRAAVFPLSVSSLALSVSLSLSFSVFLCLSVSRCLLVRCPRPGHLPTRFAGVNAPVRRDQAFGGGDIVGIGFFHRRCISARDRATLAKRAAGHFYTLSSLCSSTSVAICKRYCVRY